MNISSTVRYDKVGPFEPETVITLKCVIVLLLYVEFVPSKELDVSSEASGQLKGDGLVIQINVNQPTGQPRVQVVNEIYSIYV